MTLGRRFYPDLRACDIILKTLAYGGVNIVFLDQAFPYTRIHNHRLFLNHAEMKKLYSVDAHMWQKDQALNRRLAYSTEHK